MDITREIRNPQDTKSDRQNQKHTQTTPKTLSKLKTLPGHFSTFHAEQSLEVHTLTLNVVAIAYLDIKSRSQPRDRGSYHSTSGPCTWRKGLAAGLNQPMALVFSEQITILEIDIIHMPQFLFLDSYFLIKDRARS